MATVANAIQSFQTLIQVLEPGSSPEAWHTIKGVQDIDGPQAEVDEEETTSHDTATAEKTFEPTLIDNGSLDFDVLYNPTHATHSNTSPYGLGYLFRNRLVGTFRLVAPDPSHTTRRFNAFVKSFSESYPVNGLVRRATSLRMSSGLEEE
jgi:hypothetical protein